MAGPFSFGASASPTQQQQPQMPTDPNQLLALMFQQMMQQQQQPQHQQQGPDLGALLAQLRNDPQGDQNRAYMPGVNNEANPFSNGFFKTADQRHQIEQDRGLSGLVGGVGIPGRTDAATNPYAFGAISTTPDSITPWQGGVNPTLRNAGGGLFEGMINPGLPDAQKYGDANMFGIHPGQSSLPPGMVAGDGKTNYSRSKKKPLPKGSGSPLSGFSFGAK